MLQTLLQAGKFKVERIRVTNMKRQTSEFRRDIWQLLLEYYIREEGVLKKKVSDIFS